MLGRLLADISRNLPARPIEVSTDGNKVQLTCGSSRFSLLRMPAEEYPSLPVSPEPSGSVAGDVFTQAVAQVSIAADRSDTLPILTGVRVELDGSTMTLLATDRYRLAMRELEWNPRDTAAAAVLLIPARTLAETAKALGAAASVEIAMGDAAGGDGLVGFEAGQRRTTSRLLDGESVSYTHLDVYKRQAYNPLFVYGDSGLGKTHLLHAIGHYARQIYPHVRVHYVNSEEFTNDFINSIRDDRAASFQKRYREVDVLLIDDIQFLGGKLQTQEEFFHTFNTLHNNNKQVVITSDVPPKMLQGFEDRMRSRFEMGLLTDVQPPDLETRIAILRKKAIQERLTIPDEVLDFIASRISTNIRELEGALIRVTAFASLNRQPVDLSLAEIVLKDLMLSLIHI